MSAALGADRGAWAVENPALAEGTRMCLNLERPLERMVIADVKVARAAFTPAHWLAVLYDWMPPERFSAEESQLRNDFDAGFIWLPEVEWSVPSATAPLDVKVFLNSVLLAKPRLQRPTLQPERAGRLGRYRIRAWHFPEATSLLQGSARVGYMSFTTLTGSGSTPVAGEVELRVEFELFGGVFSVLQEGGKVNPSIPLTYTPFVRISYGPLPTSNPRS